ncbi:MAG: glycerol-3-phosphate acyltransferase, partial [Actinobacteria bacterium]|nr:glycerol-3-phosphate acyltransferase [Actinomycetota bacterium]
MLVDVLIVIGGYLVGSIPFGVVLVRLLRGEDIRAVGSGNIGATNVWRIYGRTLGLPVALLDVAKGCGPALAGLLVAGPWVGVLAGV